MTRIKKAQKKKNQDNPKSGLFATLERIDKKLDLLNVMSKTMPAFLVAVGGIVGTLGYLSLGAENLSNAPVELPVTGEEVQITNAFIILFPEYQSSITLPDTVSGLSIDGFYTKEDAVEFFIQKNDGIVKSLGIGSKGTEDGEYLAKWEEATPGQYFVWAEITGSDNITLSSAKIAVTIK